MLRINIVDVLSRRLWPSVIILFALGVVSVLCASLFTVMTVSGNSMRPTLKPGDRVLVLRQVYTSRAEWGKVKKGQVVVLETEYTGLPVIKRVVAAPGDDISIAHGRLHAGDATIILAGRQMEFLSGMKKMPAGRLLVAGENGVDSYDSRHYGLVPVTALLGRVVGMLPDRKNMIRAVINIWKREKT